MPKYPEQLNFRIDHERNRKFEILAKVTGVPKNEWLRRWIDLQYAELGMVVSQHFAPDPTQPAPTPQE